MIPGELFTASGEIEINAGRPTLILTVANTGDRPIQVGSHYHFYETNAALSFDRELARGWLSLAPGSLVIRMVGTVPVLSLLHVILGYLEAPLESYLVGRPATFEYANRHVDYLLANFLCGFLTFGCWTSIYLGFHFLEERRRAEKESWRLAAALSRARLDALRAQVNPHFLFNALDSLRALIDENPPQARDAVTRLHLSLRYSLSTVSDATV